MTFLGTYLKPITMANKLFQATDADPLKLLEEINNLGIADLFNHSNTSSSTGKGRKT